MPYSTGLPSLDAAVGGLEGVVEVQGAHSSGKTTLCHHLLRQGGLYIPAEGDYDPTLSPGLIQEGKVIVARPRFGEAALEAAAEFLPGRVVIDPASFLQPAEMLGLRLWEDPSMGTVGRMLSYGANVLADLCSERGGMVVFVQQYRRNPGAWFSGPIKVAHGSGIGAASSCRLLVRRQGYIHRRKRRVGIKVFVEVLANLRRPPGPVVRLDLHWGFGFRESASLLDLCVQRGVIQKQANRYKLQGELLGHGRHAACRTIEDESGLWGDLLAAVSR